MPNYLVVLQGAWIVRNVRTIKDAMNKLVYHDDSQICDLTVVKIWGEENRIVVELEEI